MKLFVKKNLHYIGFLLFCLLPGHVLGGFTHDSRLDWYTIHSPHFHLHYHDGLEEMARETLSLAERIHERLSKRIDWVPQEPVNLVLTDEYDFSNGMATPFPSNWIMLFATPPDDLLTLEDHAGWMELLLTHEYTHILHLDKARRGPAWLRTIFGRNFLLFPNLFQPRWMIEGYATYIETDKKRGIGRGQSSMFDSMMRTEVLNGIKPIHQINQPMASWPTGTAAYLYGVHFYQFLEETYGAKKIDALIENYSGNILPFFINSNTEDIYYKDLPILWDEFEAYLEKKYRPQIDAVKNKGVIAGKRLSTDGYFTGPLRVLPDGRAYYIAYNGEQHAGLMMIDPQGEIHRLREVNFGTRLDVHPEAGVLLIQPERCHNAAVYYDIYHVDLEGDDLEQLTDCARYRNAAWSADGKQIIAVHNKAGKNELHLLGNDGQLKNVMWRGKQWEVVGALDTSPDGQELVAAVWRNKTGWNLEQFNLKNNKWSLVTRDSAIEGHPQYSPDGTAILFTSEHGGIYNIRRKELRTDRTVTLTNVISGAVSPAESRTGDIYYLGYTGDGLDVFKLSKAQHGNDSLPAVAKGPTGQASPLPEKYTAGPAESYSAWDSMRPRWWFPHIILDEGRTELGLVTGGSDSLLQHLYAVDLAYDTDNSWSLGSFQYIYDGWYPLIKFEAERVHNFTIDGNDVKQRVRRTNSQMVEIVFPLLSMDSSWSLNFAAFKERNKDIWWKDGLSPYRTTTDNVLGMALVYDSTEHHIKSVSRSSGREVNLVMEDSDEIEGSDFKGRVYLGDWREFIRLGGEHVLAMRYAEGKGTDTTRSFRLGGIKDDGGSFSSIANPVFGTPFNRGDSACVVIRKVWHI